MPPTYDEKEIAKEIKKINRKRKPDGVAAMMRKAQAKGDKASPNSCPIACYLSWKFPNARFYVNCYGVEASEREGGKVWAYGDWSLSDAACNFIDRFDAGEYPDLELGSD